MSWMVLLGIVAVFAVLRLLKVGLVVWIPAWWGALYVFFRHGVDPPLPQSLVTMYMGISSLSLVAYIGSSRERTRSFFGPLVRFIAEKRYTVVLAVVALLIPAAVGFRVYTDPGDRIQPPFFARTVHPSPPATLDLENSTIDMIRDGNPLRALEASNPAKFAEHVQSGRDTYYENCFYCHGDALGGDGMFAYGLEPLPTNFTDAGILPNFTESFFMWRIAKGAPGLPEEGGPWDSAMPRWEQFLTDEEMWEVLLFLYDFTDKAPRAAGEFADH